MIFFDIFSETGMPDWVGDETMVAQLLGALAEGGILAMNLMPDDEQTLLEILWRMLQRIIHSIL